MQDLLVSNGIDITQYGVGVARTIANLQEEVNKGESTVSVVGDRLLRQLTTYSIVLRRGDRVLVEKSQYYTQQSLEKASLELD